LDGAEAARDQTRHLPQCQEILIKEPPPTFLLSLQGATLSFQAASVVMHMETVITRALMNIALMLAFVLLVVLMARLL
jgi:hypothetical protein